MVLVSILGDFDSNILPVFYHYSEDINIHILLYDKRRQDKLHAQNIQIGLKRFCLEYDYDPLLLVMEFDEDTKENIELIFERIDKLAYGKTLFINASDGMATTLAIFQPKVLELNGKILAYDRFDNSCNVLTKEGMHNESIAGMTINEHLLLKNIDYEMIDTDVISERSATVNELMQASTQFLDFRDAKKQRKPLNAFIEIQNKLASINKENDDFFISGGIFEEYIYSLVKGLRFDDVALGTKVCYMPDEDSSFENELDILLIKENHMHIIECKFRRFINDAEHFIYKYDSVIDMLDADGKTMLLVVGGDDLRYINGKKNVMFNGGVRRRAKYNNIHIYHEKELNEANFISAVKRFFELEN